MRSWGDLSGTRRVWAPELLTKIQFRRLPEASLNPQTQAQFQVPPSTRRQAGLASHSATLRPRLTFVRTWR